MKHYSSFTKVVFALALTAVIIGFSAFGQKEKSNRYSFRKEQSSKNDDTTAPRKRNRNGANRDFYKIEEQLKDLAIQMKNLNEQMKKLDMKGYEKEIEEAMKNINIEKMAEQINKTMKNIDWERINNQIAENAEMVSRLKMKEAARQLEKVKTNLQKQKADMQINGQKVKADIERAMKNAKQSIERAKEEIKNVQRFTEALEKNGLIDKSKPYKIEVKDGELYIDDKKQSKEVSDKYREYYRKSDFTIDMSKGNNFRI